VDIKDGQSVEIKGSGKTPYTLRNTGGVYSCSCPAWRNQSEPIERRTCKHLRKYRGDEAESARIQSPLPTPVAQAPDASSELPLLLAETWSEEQNPAGWWMSEKLDGVRAYWDGSRFLTRNNRPILAPEWFIKGLPSHALDGELWIKRKAFDRTSSIVRRQDMPAEWREVRYMVFDAPDMSGPFEERYEYLLGIEPKWPSRLQVHRHRRCDGTEHLLNELDRIRQLEGEGLMLREPNSAYVRTRSSTLLKVKVFLEDTAVVIGMTAGKGRHKGRVGAIRARLSSGVEFDVGSGLTDAIRKSPPAAGSKIKVKYQELTNDGVPRFPVFVECILNAGLTDPSDQQQGEDGAIIREEDLSPSDRKLFLTMTEMLDEIFGFKPNSSQVTGDDPEVKQTKKKKKNSMKTESQATRRFECSDGESNKFWSIAIKGSDLEIFYGKIDAKPRPAHKSLSTAEAAAKEAEKLIREKLAKGYKEVSA